MDEVPGDGVAGDAEVAAELVSEFFGEGIVPTACGVVVVGAGVEDGIFGKVVGEEGVVWMAVEGELKDGHAWEGGFY